MEWGPIKGVSCSVSLIIFEFFGVVWGVLGIGNWDCGIIWVSVTLFTLRIIVCMHQLFNPNYMAEFQMESIPLFPFVRMFAPMRLSVCWTPGHVSNPCSVVIVFPVFMYSNASSNTPFPTSRSSMKMTSSLSLIQHHQS